MNIEIIKGFTKQARANGLEHYEISNLIKAAMGEDISPDELAMLASQPSGGEMDDVDPSLLAALLQEGQEEDGQLDPEVLEQIAAALAGEEGGYTPDGAGPSEEELAMLMASQGQPQGLDTDAPVDPEELAKLSCDIEAYLSQGQTKTASQMTEAEQNLALIKQAEYIYGFLEEAQNRGCGIKEAVDLYENAYINTVNLVSQAPQTKQASALLSEEDQLTYLQGVFEKGAELGLSRAQTWELLQHN